VVVVYVIPGLEVEIGYATNGEDVETGAARGKEPQANALLVLV